ncbi:MAG: MBL fold metallo-hydrolase [Bacteroidales bacterium]|jgi:glyoxylase-like metal-dependent hydrolase (beta-lactamase superfamily II)|nr:MBL fold metallo-hydrolase [Bacteroidales bacterium]
MKKFFGGMMLIIGLAPVVALAQENPNIFTYKVGAFEICLLSEGQSAGKPGIFIGATPEMIRKCIPDGTFPTSCNAFLVRMPGKTILVDTGYGRNLFDNLKSLGVTPEQVDIILLTHMHGDHIGGMLKDGQAAFPNAEVYLAKPEHDYWMSDDAKNPNARKVIEVYRSKLHLFQPVEIDAKPNTLFAGIQAVASYGHTPGHTSFMVESGKDKLLIWGDLTHAMAIQMTYPQVAMTYDVNPDVAIASRKKTLEYVAQKKIPIAGMHIAFPGMGKIAKAPADGYSYSPFTK